MKIDPLITEWFNVYTKYIRFFNPTLSDAEVRETWSKNTDSLIEYYHSTEEIWKGDFIRFLRCHIDHYIRQNEHCTYVGFQVAPPEFRRPGNRYLP